MKTLWTTIEVAVLIAFALVLVRLQKTEEAVESWQRYSLDCSNRAVVAEAQYLQINQLLMDQTHGGFQQRQFDQQFLWEAQRANDIQEQQMLNEQNDRLFRQLR